MRAYVMPANCRSFEDIRMVERPDPAPGPGQVLVRVRATSLNRRDAAIADGSYFGKPVERETVPLSDCAGEVAAVGDGVVTVKPGDRVAATFFQIPPAGPAFAGEAPLPPGRVHPPGLRAVDDRTPARRRTSVAAPLKPLVRSVL